MPSDDQLDELLLAWQERNPPPSVAELCRDVPHLRELLAERIAVLQKMQQLVAALHGAVPAETTVDVPTGPQQAAPTGDLAEAGTGSVLRPGTLLAGYAIEEMLGAGGMGEVYRATDPVLHRPVAMKVMKAYLATDPRARERFLREARAVAALTDDHIVTLHAVGEDAGRLYLVMPLLRGQSLHDRLKQSLPLSLADALRITRETAQGLATAHRLGLVHRDIKPANLWLEAETQRVKILDFGLARSEQAGHQSGSGGFCGTPGYVAPEQVDGATPAPPADLFSLGCVLYRLVTGQGAFERSTLTAALLAVATCEPVSPAEHDPTLPPAVVELVLQLLQRRPQDRPASAGAVIAAVRAIESSLCQAATVPPRDVARPDDPGARVLPPPVQPARRRLLRWGLPLGVAAVVLLGVTAFVSHRWRTQPDTTPTQASVVPPLAGSSIDVSIWKRRQFPDQPEGAGVRLSFPNVLPLQPGDWMRIEVTMARPIYLYVIWLESSGAAIPIYPWQKRQWEMRPTDELPHQALTFPSGADRAASPLGGGPAGVETMLLLARDTPLPAGAETQIQEVFQRVWKPSTLKEARPFALWLENGNTVHEQDRGAIVDKQAQPILNPVLQTQQRLQRALQPWFTYSRAVCYSFKGD